MNENYIFEDFIENAVDGLLKAKMEELKNNFDDDVNQKADIESISKEIRARFRGIHYDVVLMTLNRITYDEASDMYHLFCKDLSNNDFDFKVKNVRGVERIFYQAIDQTYKNLMSSREMKELREKYDQQIAELKKADFKALLMKEFDMLVNAYHSLLPIGLNDSQKKFTDTILGLIHRVKEEDNHFIVTDGDKTKIITSDNKYSYCYNAVKTAYQLYQTNDILRMNDLSICIQQDPANFKKQANDNVTSTGNKPIKTNVDNATKLNAGDGTLTAEELEAVRKKTYTKKIPLWVRKQLEHQEKEELAGRKISRIPGVDKGLCFISGLEIFRKFKNGFRLVRSKFGSSEEIRLSDITGKDGDKNTFISKKEYDKIIAQQGSKSLKATEKAAEELHNPDYDVKITSDNSKVELKDPVLLLENKHNLEKRKDSNKDRKKDSELLLENKDNVKKTSNQTPNKTPNKISNQTPNKTSNQTPNNNSVKEVPQSSDSLDELSNMTKDELIALIKSGSANKYTDKTKQTSTDNLISTQQPKETEKNIQPSDSDDRFATYHRFKTIQEKKEMWDKFVPILDDSDYKKEATANAKKVRDERQKSFEDEQLNWNEKNKKIIEKAKLQNLKAKLSVANINGDLNLENLSKLTDLVDNLPNEEIGKSR